ncbi:MAG: CynX/NimT family MFS transporter [Marinobacterium sp.]|jgi:MFS family permease|uniref:MFS transporter n=1 Tax=Marinobacterium iners TaxID=48076 RepID=UPI001F5C27F8|nr:MFS transporter [Marinobacterium iners]
MRSLAPEFVVMLAGITAALHIGKLPPAIPVLQDALGVTLVEAGFLLSLVQLAGMLAGALIGLLADSAGLRRSVLLGLGILMLASLLGSQAQSAAMLLLLRGIEGFGFLLVTLSGPGLIRHLVVAEKLSLRLGWWGCYMGLGTGTALLAGPWVMAQVGWQGWWILMALLSLLMLFWVWRAVPPDQQLHTRQEGPVGGALGRVLGRLKLTLSHPGPWLVAMIFATYSGQWLSVIGFLPSIYSEAGISAGLVGPLTALAAVVNIIGNVLSGRLLHVGVGARQLLYGGFAVMAMTTWFAFSALTADFPWLRYLAVLLFSAIGGMVPGALFSLAVRLAPDSSVVSTCVGWMLQWSAFGQFVAPPAIAWLAAQAGGWHWTWMATGAMSLLGVVLVTRVSRLPGFAAAH